MGQENNGRYPDGNKLPRWASIATINGTSGKNNTIEPDSAKKDLGWDHNELPTRNHINWLLNTIYQWLSYLKEQEKFILRENEPADLEVFLVGGSFINEPTVDFTVTDQSVILPAEPSVGNNRIDMIYIAYLDASINIIQGVETAGTPAKPALTTLGFTVGYVTRSNGEVSITNDVIENDSPRFAISNLATTDLEGVIEYATDAEAQAKSAFDKGLTPENLAALDATESFVGMLRVATQAETDAGIIDNAAVTPLKLTSKTPPTVAGFVAANIRYSNRSNLVGYTFSVEPANAWRTIGPTGSSDIVWTALDVLPTDGKVVAIDVNIELVSVGNTDNTLYENEVYAALPGQGNTPTPLDSERVAMSSWIRATGTFNRIETSQLVTLPIDSNLEFDLQRRETGSPTLIIVLLELRDFHYNSFG